MFFRCQYPIIWHRFSYEPTSDCVAHFNAFISIVEPIFDDSRSLAGSIDILLKHPVFLGTTSVNGVIFFSNLFIVLLCILHSAFNRMKTSRQLKSNALQLVLQLLFSSFIIMSISPATFFLSLLMVFLTVHIGMLTSFTICVKDSSDYAGE